MNLRANNKFVLKNESEFECDNTSKEYNDRLGYSYKQINYELIRECT